MYPETNQFIDSGYALTKHLLRDSQGRICDNFGELFYDVCYSTRICHHITSFIVNF